MSFSGIKPKFDDIGPRMQDSIDSLVKASIDSVNWSIAKSKLIINSSKRVYNNIAFYFQEQLFDSHWNAVYPSPYRLVKGVVGEYLTKYRNRNNPPMNEK